MSPRKISIIVISSLFVLLATACNGVPDIASAAQPELTATVAAPTVAPVAPMPESTPAPNAQNKNAPNALNGLASMIQATGWKAGIVRTNNASTLSLRLRTGAYQVQTNADTIVVIPGKSDVQVSDIHTGDRVLVKVANDDLTQPAALVMVVPSDLTKENLLLAAVQSNKQGTLTIRTLKDKQDVATNSSTVVLDLNNGQPVLSSLGNLKQGNAIIVVGNESDTAFDAQTIIVIAQDARTFLQRHKQKQPLPGS
ncbi:MAG: hypothetical protein HZB51_34770 [Chloroflexi bacterium]|nr:hypothetical protein [Chloroflexota bacterium]